MPASPNRSKTLIPKTTIAAAGTIVGDEASLQLGVKSLAIRSNFLYGSGGTTAKVFVQTSLDGGASWIDIACHAFLLAAAEKITAVKTDIAVAAAVTPTDGSMTDDTILDGVLGDRVRVKFISTGTYAGATSIEVTVAPN